jgi:hypothetical protein
VTFEELLGVIAAVYHTPLPMVMDMPICSIASYASICGRIMRLTNPLAGDDSEPQTMNAEQFRRMLS